ncbi:dihydrofolate reductase family protein [Taibaiella soli]|uniref:Dihydrofolate reductase n=1 Tax=Taibaiella soli TaxID=1649169 RepID=A0A2W2BSW5_9BACT|nr:dihydrofolate reductase family protein [Taibaiella soli]PZF70833.1 dihydrofolate reductase [Taibaiella soli]
MGNIVLFMHCSLDGFAAGTKGEMNWIQVDQELFDYVEERIAQTNTALYGRVTFQMMESYWPTAADQPGATKHDKVHAVWYKNAHKVVLSNTLNEADFKNTTVIGKNYASILPKLKEETKGDILLFGSPSTAHALLAENLIDECWIFINPVLLGEGIPVFKGIKEKEKLKLLKTHVFSSGVVCLNYDVQRGN